MKSAMEVFLEYASDFEETYKDDNWSRLEPYFAKDATYEIRGGPYACKLVGPQAIFAGLKKSLDGMDRRCSERKIEVTEAPQTKTTPDGEEMSLGWHASYINGDAPRGGFAGRSVAVVADGVIVAMWDEYNDAEMAQFEAWIRDNNVDIDGSYV